LKNWIIISKMLDNKQKMSACNTKNNQIVYVKPFINSI